MEYNNREENEKIINTAIRKAFKIYARYDVGNNYYDVNKVIKLFKRTNARILDPVHVDQKILNRVYSIRKALDKNDLTFDEYFSVKDEESVINNDLMYIDANNVSFGEVDDFIDAIKNELYIKKVKEEGDRLEQNQSDETEPSKQNRRR